MSRWPSAVPLALGPQPVLGPLQPPPSSAPLDLGCLFARDLGQLAQPLTGNRHGQVADRHVCAGQAQRSRAAVGNRDVEAQPAVLPHDSQVRSIQPTNHQETGGLDEGV